MQRFKQPNMDLHPDGEWIRYEDHCEAMKRIAGAPVAQGLTPEFLADAIPQAATIIYGEQEKAVRMNYDEIREFARAILAQSAPRADHAGEGAEMVARKCTRCEYIGRCDCELAPAPSASAKQAEPVANNEAYDLAYDKIDRFLRSNLDDDDYAEFSRALDSLFAAPAPSASPAALTDEVTKAIDKLVRTAWESGQQDEIDGVRWEDKGDSYNQWLRSDIERDKKALAALLAASPVALTEDQIREVFLANGFTIKEGQTDLKPYVYAAARALLALAASPADQGEDARDAARYRFIKDSRLILSGGTTKFGWAISPFGEQCDRYIDAAMSATPPAADKE